MEPAFLYFCEKNYLTIHKNCNHVTKLGEYLTRKSVNKAIVARKTGLSKQRMGELTLNEDAKLRAREVYLIALAIGVSPCELFEYVCQGLTLKE
jgi:hypothetical protein